MTEALSLGVDLGGTKTEAALIRRGGSANHESPRRAAKATKRC